MTAAAESGCHSQLINANKMAPYKTIAACQPHRWFQVHKSVLSFEDQRRLNGNPTRSCLKFSHWVSFYFTPSLHCPHLYLTHLLHQRVEVICVALIENEWKCRSSTLPFRKQFISNPAFSLLMYALHFFFQAHTLTHGSLPEYLLNDRLFSTAWFHRNLT